ncbi:hypothetical protein CKAN_01859400 [Cinnamomum micranthum f. kanehirae]|uniref:Uncharacterized protein n=1 Tax=Cinnamomum micranthum f. kanehirae TaxID=337451 RepID=A0A443PFH4_9MAGN|nr:hypothetical protein CKAN_01859400 [Cinnamomum micranthum f. kanehirae]
MPAFGHCSTEITLQHQKRKQEHKKEATVKASAFVTVFGQSRALGLGMKSEEANSKIISWGDKEVPTRILRAVATT